MSDEVGVSVASVLDFCGDVGAQGGWQDARGISSDFWSERHLPRARCLRPRSVFLGFELVEIISGIGRVRFEVFEVSVDEGVQIADEPFGFRIDFNL